MKIVVVGAGTVGMSLAEHLSRQKHTVSVIEQDPRLCEEISGRLDVLTVNGRGGVPSALEEAGIRSADIVIAVTPEDDTNIVVCALARQYGVKKRVARVTCTEHTDPSTPVDLAAIGVTDVIEPEKEVVRNILKYIALPGVTEAANFHFNSVYLRGYRVTEEMPIANRMLSEINEFHDKGTVLVVQIIRNGLAIIPAGSEMILPDDEIIAFMAPDSLPAFRAMVGLSAGRVKKIVVSGDSRTVVHLVRELPKFAERVVLVDPDEKHAQETAAHADGVEILHGDCTRVEMLQEVHVENAAFFIAAGRDLEDNVMACLLAKAEGAREVIAVGSARRHVELFHSLGLDRLIIPHEITLQTIIANVLHMPVGAQLKLHSGDTEIARFTVSPKSRAVGMAVCDLDDLVSEPMIIGTLIRGDQVLLPSGSTVIQEGDEVLVVSQSEGSESWQRVFEGGMHLPF